MDLKTYLEEKNISEKLKEAVLKLEKIAEKISIAIHEEEKWACWTCNTHWEDQLTMDIFCDKIFIKELKNCTWIATLVSEEQDEEIKVFEDWEFTFSYDPIDWSSLVETNLSIWSIFAIYKWKTAIWNKLSNIICTWSLVFWPRTTMLISFWDEVCEFTLHHTDKVFYLSQKNIQIKEDTKIYSPWNLRAVTENEKYKKVIDKWLKQKKTLRYSWWMVPDLNQIFCKNQWIFTYPWHSKYPNWKLRLVYEVWPFSFLAEAAWWKSLNEKWQRILDLEIQDIHERSTIIIWSKNEVDEVASILN